MKKKATILMLTVAVLAIALAFSVSAAETYTVESDEAYEEIYAQAVDGDTITVTSKLTCDIQATKDITYILKA
ncbi:MAG: hypothetical protein IJ039_00960, partial [Clostridia bacterium]|nr:hypothetical protein [Clostridia bacterium]